MNRSNEDRNKDRISYGKRDCKAHIGKIKVENKRKGKQILMNLPPA